MPYGGAPHGAGAHQNLASSQQQNYYRREDFQQPPPAAEYHGGGRSQSPNMNTGGSPGRETSRRMYRPNSLWTWSFAGVALAQALVSLSLEAYVFAKFQDALIPAAGAQEDRANSDVKAIPTYLALLIFGFIYELWLVWDALSAKNTIQIIGICAMNLAIMVYMAIQKDQVKEAFDNLKSPDNGNPNGTLINVDFYDDVIGYLIALPIIAAIGTVLLSFIAWKLYEEFAWTIYKQISADLRLKKRYLIYQIYIALLKFDFFLFVGFVVQFLVIVHNTSGAEFYLTIAALPIIIVLLGLAAWSTRRENIFGMAVTILVYFVALAYFFFKLIRMYTADAARRSDYAPARRTLTVFAAITILFLIITIVIACWCTHNFNKGLKPHISRSARMKEEQQGKTMYMNDVQPKYDDDGRPSYPPPHFAGGSRMEID